MNFLDRLLGRNDDPNRYDDVLAEADAKAERIKFHREHVRNGPRDFKTVSSGQVRRAEARERRSQARKTTKRMRRAHFQGQLAEASLRGRLQVTDAVPFNTYPMALRRNAAHSLEDEYGTIAEAAETYDRLQKAKAAERARRAASAVA